MQSKSGTVQKGKKRRKEEEKHAEKKALNEKGKNHVGDAKVKEEIYKLNN